MGGNRNGIKETGTGIREASETSYEITFPYRGERCRERVKLKPSPANLKRVTNFLGAIKQAIEKGTFDYSVSFPDSPRRFKFIDHPGDILTVSDYLSSWLERREPHLKDSTVAGYRKIVHLELIPAIGSLGLTELKRSHVRDMLTPKTSGNKRLSNIQSVLRAALQDAVMDDIIETNPLFGWKFSRKDSPEPNYDVDPFTREEQELILSKLDGQERNLFQFAFWTGMRTSEYVALDWGDIDWLRREAYVTRALTQDARGKAEVTKTTSSKRRIKLLEPAYQALLAQKQHTFLADQEVFQNPRTLERWAGDQPIRPRWLYALKAAGVRYRRPYQTRHTYASMMLSAGEPPMWVANQMGHADWGMIRKTYGKFMPDAIPDAGDRAVKIYGENAGTNAGKEGPKQTHSSPILPNDSHINQ